MCYVKCLPYEEGETFPMLVNGFCVPFPCSETVYEAWQPEEIENDEFNTFILIEGIAVKVRSSHFDFVKGE